MRSGKALRDQTIVITGATSGIGLGIPPLLFRSGTRPGATENMVVHNATQGQVAAGMMPDAAFTPLPGLGHMIHHFAPSAVLEAALSLG